MSFSFGVDRRHRPFMTSKQVAEDGAIAPFVYHDVNANGHFDPAVDEPLSGVGFSGTGRRQAKTDASGDALLTGLSVAEPVVVDVDQTSLKDPFWVSAGGPVVVDPRPGKITPVAIAIVDGGEISGTVSAKSDAEPIGGVVLQLVGPDKRVFGKVNTLSDGSYLFEAVPPGAYRVEIVGGQQINNTRVPVQSASARLLPSGDAVDGIDFTIDIGERKLAAGAADDGDAGALPAAQAAEVAGPHFDEATRK
jgi:hypothetical protein